MEFYHALNRGVDKRNIFEDDGDRARFVHDMFEFNKVGIAYNTARKPHEIPDLRSRVSPGNTAARLVDIHAWCLMNNHYHLLLSADDPNAISLFLRKLNVGYAKSFNEKYGRTGTLLQGRTKKILVQNDTHLRHLVHYVHLNPLDYLGDTQDWREMNIKNPRKAFEFLTAYKWSSLRDYLELRNFPSVLHKDFVNEIYPNYKKELTGYLRHIQIPALKSAELE